uniref:Secreted protein n=1 Tax=Cacopsylla melanoneura TaxID=428564 RepID=A0A8D8UPJ9_9HEMI
MISNRPLSRLPLSLSLFSFLSLSLFSNTYSYSTYNVRIVRIVAPKAKGRIYTCHPLRSFAIFTKFQVSVQKHIFFFYFPDRSIIAIYSIKWKKKKNVFLYRNIVKIA